MLQRLFALGYDRLMADSEEACLGPWRQALLAGAKGRVLEVGAGTGANLRWYPDEGCELLLSEPSPHMRAQLEEKAARSGRAARVCEGSLMPGGLPVEDASVDVLVSTLVLCSVPELDGALAEMRRVLRPEGELRFLEHVAAAPGTRRRRWQGYLEPVWRRCAGNCHLTRETEAAIEAAGFEIESIERESMRRAMPVVRPTVRGRARLSAARCVR